MSEWRTILQLHNQKTHWHCSETVQMPTFSNEEVIEGHWIDEWILIYSYWFIIILIQEPLCSDVKELECVNLAKVNVDTSSCLKPCSGLIITSFAKSDKNLDLDSRLPFMDEYNNYKKITRYPSGYNGKSKIYNN